jgi:hypothetical protein
MTQARPAETETETGHKGRSQALSLSHKGLGRAARLRSEDFKFVFGKEEYFCDRFRASFVSERVCRMLESDSSVDEFVISAGDECGFEILAKLLEGEIVEMNEGNCSSLDFLSVCLENEELSSKIAKFRLGGEEVCKSNAISRLLMKIDHKTSAEEEVEFISSHFYEFNSEELGKLKTEELETILSSPSLRLTSEDLLLEVICELGDTELVRYVESCNLSRGGIDKFVEVISGEDFVFDVIVWSSICRRLVGNVASAKSSERFVESETKASAGIPESVKRNSEEFEFRNSAFSGILSHLTHKFGGNVHEKGIVEITSSGDGGNNKPWQVANHGWNSYWISQNVPNSWICFDFKQNSVSLKNYTLKTNAGGPGGYHLREWVIEGSNDGRNWELLDRRNTEELNGLSFVKTFNCSTENSSKFFRFLRLKQTG